MSGNIFGNSKRLIFCLLILLCFSSSAFSFQKDLSGNFNQPKTHVVTIGVDRVTVDNVTGFQANDTILLIQMQGVKIYTDQGFYGGLENKYGEPGMWEFLIIDYVTIPTKEIVFKRELLKTYDPRGSIQIVRVPYYYTATVTGKLTCDPWSPVTRSGGVIAMIIGRTLKLNADIDVSGTGFSGGKDTTGDGNCRATNTSVYGRDSYVRSDPYAGFKGEGIANYSAAGSLLYPGFSRGFGPNFTGGGGGNGRYSGGGGGSNRNLGGDGGIEDASICGAPFPGGTGGIKADHTALPGRMYMGGGGGASTSLTGTSTPGGNGGGIVIIIADTLIGNGGRILSNGGNGGTAIANAGSGGGGAAGSIGLSVNSYGSDSLKFYLNGGRGGDNPGLGGEGGGGSGGLLWVSTPLTPKVKTFLSGGSKGTSQATSALNGGIGENRPVFKANLNGFLFNSIRSSVTGDQIDSICSNVIPKKITGTTPVGGILPYAYVWEKKRGKNGSWTILTNDADPTNYTPTAFETGSDTVYFRRTISDSSPIPFVDISKPVEIIVQPAITGNLVDKDTTICFGQNPLSLIQKISTVVAKGNGRYQYQWFQNLTNTNWNSSPHAAGPASDTIPAYDPPVLTDTTYYQRKVTSGRCIDYSPTVTITVLPLITGNARISMDTVICEGFKFNSLKMTGPAGGDGISANYKYQWQDSITSSVWSPAALTNTNAIYLPDTSAFAVIEQRFLRRVVFSGPDNVCQDRGLPVKLTRYHKIKNNIITSLNDTIGYRTIPALLQAINLVPGDGGNNVFSYQWQDSIKTSPNFLSATGTSNGQNYQPGKLTDTAWYRRIVNSDVCKNTSNIIAVFVHDSIIYNQISVLTLTGPVQDTICSGSTPASQVGKTPNGGSGITNDYSFQWKSSTTETGGYSVIPGATGPAYQPGALTQTTYYRRYVSSPILSPTSVSESNYIKITVHSKIAGNTIPADTAVCMNDTPHKLTGSTPTGGNTGQYNYLWKQSFNGGTSWSVASGISNGKDYQPPAISDTVKYRRFVMSGTQDACKDSTPPMTMTMNVLPAGFITPATDRYCEGVQVPLTINLSGKSPWTVKYTDGFTTGITQTLTGTVSTINRTQTPTGDSTIYTYVLTEVQDNNKCFATSLSAGVRKSTIVTNPHANAGPDAPFCGPIYQLAAVKSHGNGTWTMFSGPVPGSFDNATKANAIFTADQSNAAWGLANIFKLVWREDNWICNANDTVKITLNKPVSKADAGSDEVLYSLGKQDTLHAVKPLIGTGSWSVTSGGATISSDSIVKNLTTGINEFEWKVVNGACEDIDRKIITVYELKVPEGFSPNGDGINDEFEIQGLNTDQDEITLRVLNSAGTEVYFSTNADGGIWTNWNGENSNGVLPEGTYYYILTIRSKNGNTMPPTSGFIILKRYNFQ